MFYWPMHVNISTVGNYEYSRFFATPQKTKRKFLKSSVVNDTLSQMIKWRTDSRVHSSQPLANIRTHSCPFFVSIMSYKSTIFQFVLQKVFVVHLNDLFWGIKWYTVQVLSTYDQTLTSFTVVAIESYPTHFSRMHNDTTNLLFL